MVALNSSTVAMLLSLLGNNKVSLLFLRKHGILYHYYADDCQIYVPLKKADSFSLEPLLNSLDDVEAWMAGNFLHLMRKSQK